MASEVPPTASSARKTPVSNALVARVSVTVQRSIRKKTGNHTKGHAFLPDPFVRGATNRRRHLRNAVFLILLTSFVERKVPID
jgi:hypothetical protein